MLPYSSHYCHQVNTLFVNPLRSCLVQLQATYYLLVITVQQDAQLDHNPWPSWEFIGLSAIWAISGVYLTLYLLHTLLMTPQLQILGVLSMCISAIDDPPPPSTDLHHSSIVSEFIRFHLLLFTFFMLKSLFPHLLFLSYFSFPFSFTITQYFQGQLDNFFDCWLQRTL